MVGVEQNSLMDELNVQSKRLADELAQRFIDEMDIIEDQHPGNVTALTFMTGSLVSLLQQLASIVCIKRGTPTAESFDAIIETLTKSIDMALKDDGPYREESLMALEIYKGMMDQSQ